MPLPTDAKFKKLVETHGVFGAIRIISPRDIESQLMIMRRALQNETVLSTVVERINEFHNNMIEKFYQDEREEYLLRKEKLISRARGLAELTDNQVLTLSCNILEMSDTRIVVDYNNIYEYMEQAQRDIRNKKRREAPIQRDKER